MDLYDFIGNDYSRPSQGAGNEAAAKSGSKREFITTEQERSDALEGQFEELKKKRDELVLQLQASETDREKAMGRINALETQVAALKAEQNDLQMRLSQEKDKALSEADNLLKVKLSEIQRLSTDISALQLKLSDTLIAMERVESEKLDCHGELAQVRKDFSVYKQATKIAIVIACIVVLAAAAGFFIYLTNTKAPEQKKAAPPAAATDLTEKKEVRSELPVAPPPRQKIVAPAVARWSGKPVPLEVGDFRIAIIPMESGAVKKISKSLKREEAQTHYYYMVQISAAGSELSGEFLKSPDIDFIDKSNSYSRQTSAGLKVVHTSLSGSGKRGNVLFQGIVSLRKDFKPNGIIIRHPNKEIIKIMIF